MNDLKRLLEMSGIHHNQHAIIDIEESLNKLSHNYQIQIDENGKITIYTNDASHRWFFDNFDDMIEKGLSK